MTPVGRDYALALMGFDTDLRILGRWPPQSRPPKTLQVWRRICSAWEHYDPNWRYTPGGRLPTIDITSLFSSCLMEWVWTDADGRADEHPTPIVIDAVHHTARMLDFSDGSFVRGGGPGLERRGDWLAGEAWKA